MSENKLVPFKDEGTQENSIQVRTNNPTLVPGVPRIWFNTTTEELKYYDGSTTQTIPYAREDDGIFKKLNQNNSKKIASNLITFDADCYDYTVLVNIVSDRGNGSDFNIDLNSMQENTCYTLRLAIVKFEGSRYPVGKGFGFLNTIYREENDTIIKNSSVLNLTKINNILNVKIEKELANIKGITQNWNWGFNNVGQLGDNTAVSKSSPVQVVGQSDFVAISAGGQYSLALKADGRVFSWGRNASGNLGDNTIVTKSSPVQVVGQSDFIAVSAGNAHSLALKADGRVFAWGDNFNGQLGDNTAVSKSSPVQVIGQSDFVAISAGSGYSLALKADGRVFAWGIGAQGRLGDNTIVNKSSPAQVVGQSNFVAISAGSSQSLALKKY